MSFIQPINKIDQNPLLYGQKTLWLKILQENNIKIPKTAVISHELFLKLVATKFSFLSEFTLNPQKLIQKLPEIQNWIKALGFNDQIWKEIYREFDKLDSPRFAFKTSLNPPFLDQLFPSLFNNRLERTSENIRNTYQKLFSPEIVSQIITANKPVITSLIVQGMVYGSMAGSICLRDDKIIIEAHKTADTSKSSQYILDMRGNLLNMPRNESQNLNHLLYPDLISGDEIAHLYLLYLKTKNLLGLYTKLVWLKNDDFCVVDLGI